MKKIKIILVLIASIIGVVISLLQKYSLKRLSYTLLIIIIIFYIIGIIIESILNKTINEEEEKIELDNDGDNISNDSISNETQE